MEHPEHILRSHLDEKDTLKLVVPVVRQGFLDWLANDEGAFSEARSVAEQAAAERGVPSVAAMHPENPGVDVAGKAYVVPTAVNVAGMRDALPRLARVASALAAGRELGTPDEEGYLPRGF